MPPELARLIDSAVLDRAAAGDHGQRADAFGGLAREAIRRGELTAGQAGALAALLGLWPCHPANDR